MGAPQFLTAVAAQIPRDFMALQSTMPPFLTFLSTWHFDAVALAVIVVYAMLYLLGVRSLRRRGHAWPRRLTAYFYGLGLGSFAWVSFGFLGTYSTELRWAFTTRVVLLLFVVPAGLSLGKPIALALIVLRGKPRRVLRSILRSWPLRLISNAVFATFFALALFMVFVTPFAGVLRQSDLAQAIFTIAVPLMGLVIILPASVRNVRVTTFLITAQFLLVFAELMMDAIPGIVIRIQETVTDHVGAVAGILPYWFPNPLRDQQLSGDLLWAIAEVVDIPVLALLFIVWRRSDKRDAKDVDKLTDEQMEELMKEHLRGPYQAGR